MDYYSRSEPRSNWWFLLPVLLGILGGLIAWFILRNSDPSKGRYCLIVGAVATALPWLFALSLNV